MVQFKSYRLHIMSLDKYSKALFMKTILKKFGQLQVISMEFNYSYTIV